MISNCKVIKFF